MRRLRANPLFATAAAVVALLVGPAPAPTQESPQETAARVVSSAITVTSGPRARAELEIELDDGAEHTLSFRDGTVRIDGRAVGSYEPGGSLETAWRSLLSRHAGAEPVGLGEHLLEWSVPGLAGEEADAFERLQERLRTILAVAPPPPAGVPTAETVTVTGPDGDQLAIAPGPLSFESLAGRLERLERALDGLGEAAEEARERLALVVHDDYAVPTGAVVPGNLALLGGTLSLAGTVRGDALLLDGTLVLEPEGRIEGDLLQVGGELRESGGRVGGEILSLRPVAGERPPRPEAAPAPDRPRRSSARVRHSEPGLFDRAARNLGRAVDGIAGTLTAFLVLGLLGLAAVYFGRPQLEAVADTARYSLVRSFGMGLAGQVLIGPVLLVLIVLVLTWLVIPFFLLGLLLAAGMGYLAAAHAAGEIFAARRYRYAWLERLRRSNSYYYVLSGLALLLLPFAIEAVLWIFGGFAGFLRGLAAAIGWILAWAAATTGFGAVLLTRGGTQGPHARPGAEWGGLAESWSSFRGRRGAARSTAPDAPEEGHAGPGRGSPAPGDGEGSREGGDPGA